jgi:hypothetical protein
MHEFIVSDKKTRITKTFYYDLDIGKTNVRVQLFVKKHYLEKIFQVCII